MVLTVLVASTLASWPQFLSAQRGEVGWNQFCRCLGGGFSAGYHWRNPGHKVDYYNPYSERNTVLVTGVLPQGAACYLSKMSQPSQSVIEGNYDLGLFSEGHPPAMLERYQPIPESAPTESATRMLPNSSEAIAVDRDNSFVPTGGVPRSVASGTRSDAIEFVQTPATRSPLPSGQPVSSGVQSAAPDDLPSSAETVTDRPTLWPGLYDQRAGKVSSIPYPVQHRKLRRSKRAVGKTDIRGN
jgi:hypothetical protein